jgi:capsular polysaccharide biosynthesis protein
MKTLLVGAITASLLIAAVVYTVSATRTPTYEASAVLLVDQEGSPAREVGNGKIQLIPLALPPEELQALTQTMIIAINTRPVAEEAIQRLGLDMSPDDLLSNLAIEQVVTSQYIRLTYTDTDPARATQVVNTVGQVSSERVSVKNEANNITATVYEKAIVPDTPASPHPWRNGLIALVVALPLASLAALIEARRRVRLNEERER